MTQPSKTWSHHIKVGEAGKSKQGPYVPVDQSARRSVTTVWDLYSRMKLLMQHINSHLHAFHHCLDHFESCKTVCVLIRDPKILRKCSEPQLHRWCTQNCSLMSLRTEQANHLNDSQKGEIVHTRRFNLGVKSKGIRGGVQYFICWWPVWQLTPTTNTIRDDVWSGGELRKDDERVCGVKSQNFEVMLNLEGMGGGVQSMGRYGS